MTAQKKLVTVRKSTKPTVKDKVMKTPGPSGVMKTPGPSGVMKTPGPNATKRVRHS